MFNFFGTGLPSFYGHFNCLQLRTLLFLEQRFERTDGRSHKLRSKIGASINITEPYLIFRNYVGKFLNLDVTDYSPALKA